MAGLRFKLADRTYTKTVDAGTEERELDRFVRGNEPYAYEWVEVDDGDWIRRDAVLSVRVADDEPGADSL